MGLGYGTQDVSNWERQDAGHDETGQAEEIIRSLHCLILCGTKSLSGDGCRGMSSDPQW